MADDYSTTALVKAALQIDDTSEDALIASKRTAASRMIDRYCGRRFYLDAVASARVINPAGRTWVDRDGEHLIVPDIGNIDDLVVEVGEDPDWTVITDDVEVEPTDALDRDPAQPVTSLLYKRRRFSGSRRVRVTVRWGWPAVPDEVDEAGLLQTVRLYKRKDSPEGVLGSPEWGGAIRMSRVDPDVAALLERLVVPGIG